MPDQVLGIGLGLVSQTSVNFFRDFAAVDPQLTIVYSMFLLIQLSWPIWVILYVHLSRTSIFQGSAVAIIDCIERSLDPLHT